MLIPDGAKWNSWQVNVVHLFTFGIHRVMGAIISQLVEEYASDRYITGSTPYNIPTLELFLDHRRVILTNNSLKTSFIRGTMDVNN